MTKQYVLVHGACHGAWCWDAVRALLRRRGHQVVTLDLPGHGRRAGEVRRASVESYARAVADAMAREGVGRGIVVGHSMGGIVIPKVAELCPGRVAHLVFLAAVVVPDGGNLAATNATAPARELLRGMVAGRGDGTFLYPAETAWARWMGDLSRDHPRALRALSLLTPQAIRPFVEPVDLRVFYAMRVPRTYIRCLADVAVPPDRAAGYAARLGVTPVDMTCAHNAMLSAPGELTRILERIEP
ncbi:MAG: alpha/beta fold hydrolase [Candidatus Rokubacteria bacterium]|nr:alpha/beta fold hydrolase [Candidatus Rokubacteria bacterium]MBI2525681.1 alpha/beta fold hydrolase [Candidatus Rokubacteria bacterium]